MSLDSDFSATSNARQPPSSQCESQVGITFTDILLDRQELEVLVYLADLSQPIAHEKVVAAEDCWPEIFGKQ